MIPRVIQGANVKLEGGEGVASLFARFDGRMYQSAWEPTLAELEALNAGGSVVLLIVGQAHPCVAVAVTAPAAE